METKKIEVGLNYNIGNYESHKAYVTVELKPGETVEEANRYASEQCALILSGNSSDIYEDCMNKLGFEASAEVIARLEKEQEANLQKIKELKAELADSGFWIEKLEDAKHKIDDVRKVFDISNSWMRLNELILDIIPLMPSDKKDEETEQDENESSEILDPKEYF